MYTSHNGKLSAKIAAPSHIGFANISKEKNFAEPANLSLQLNSSSILYAASFDIFFSDFFRRLTSLGAWCSKEIDTDQWFQIDLLRTTNVTAIASQGLEIMGDDGYWVTEYSLNYSCDGVRWFPHWHEGTSMVSYVKL